MRIVCDLDGVICQLKQPGQSYADVSIKPGAVEWLTAARAQGHYIIIYSARHMRTCNGDISQVMARVGKVTLDWLAHHGVPYDEIHFGKPYADVYIDDLGYRFESWSHLSVPGLSTSPQEVLP